MPSSPIHDAWAIGQAARYAQNAIDGCAAVIDALKAGADPLAATVPFVVREAMILAEAPPWVESVPVSVFTREVRVTPLRVAIKRMEVRDAE